MLPRASDTEHESDKESDSYSESDDEMMQDDDTTAAVVKPPAESEAFVFIVDDTLPRRKLPASFGQRT